MKYLLAGFVLMIVSWDLGAFNARAPRAIAPISRASSTTTCNFLLPSARSGYEHAVNRHVRDAALQFGLDEELLYSVIFVESRCREGARSPRGAIGLMQVMPTTAQQMGYSPHTVRGNIFAGAKYLSHLSGRFNGQIPLILAAYNAGPEAVRNARGIPNYRETRNYVERVMRSYKQLRRTEA